MSVDPRRVAQALAVVRAHRGLDVPRSFLGFCEWVGVTPQPGQAELVRVAYDGEQPLDVELARRIFGDIDFANLPPDVRDVIVGVCGGRGGKTYVLVALKLVHGMLVRDLSPLAAGQEAAATVVAPSERLRQEAVNYALGVMRSRPELAALLRLPRGTRPDDVVSTFGVFRRDFNRVVTFNAAPATRGGYAVRGYWHTDLCLDEAAFFRDHTYKINDEEIMNAGTPRVLPGGQTIIMSTPWAEAGLLYDLWAKNFGNPQTALVAHAPTLVLNDADYTRKKVAAEYVRNPENAAREYGAQFVKGGTTVFFPPDLIEACVDDSLDPDGVREPLPGDEVAAGVDLGFVSDSTSLAVTHMSNGKLVLAQIREWRPESGRALKPAATLREMRTEMLRHGISMAFADAHYIENAREVLGEADMTVVLAPPPDEVYVRARQTMRSGCVRIPRHERLIRQLREVQGRPMPGGKMSVIQPRWAKGGHGDLCSAFVLALWQLVVERIPDEDPNLYSAAWEAKARAARKAKLQEELDRPEWMAGRRH